MAGPPAGNGGGVSAAGLIAREVSIREVQHAVPLESYYRTAEHYLLQARAARQAARHASARPGRLGSGEP
jgi:hypothetical protein